MKRRDQLDQQIQEAMSKPNKTDADKQKESDLLDHWVGESVYEKLLKLRTHNSLVPDCVRGWTLLMGNTRPEWFLRGLKF